jgi:hypothetical protein
MPHEEAAGARPFPRGTARAVRIGRLFLLTVAAILGLATAVVLLGPVLVRQVVRLLNFSVQGFVWIVGGLEQGLDAGSLVAEIARAIGASLTTPEFGGGIVFIEIVGVAALYALHRLLSNDKGTGR